MQSATHAHMHASSCYWGQRACNMHVLWLFSYDKHVFLTVKKLLAIVTLHV